MDERHSQILLALRHITEEVSAVGDFHQALATLVQRIRQTTAADCCSLYLSDDLRKRYRLCATDGLSLAAVGKATLEYGEGLVGVVGAKREILNLADAPSHPNFKYLPEVGEDEYKSFLGVPVINQGDLLGVLVVQSKEQRQFGETEESFMVTLAAQLASMIASDKELHAGDDATVKRLHGMTGTGELAIAPALVWQPDVSLESIKVLHCDDAQLQQELFHQIIFQLQLEMDRAALKMHESAQEHAVSGYISGYGRMLDDEDLQQEIDQKIEEQGLLASSAVKLVLEDRLELAKAAGNHELWVDLKDFAQVVVSRLVHAAALEFELKEPVILVCESLPAAMVAELPRDKIAGFVATSMSTSNHAAILAHDLGIPSVLGVPIDINAVDGHTLVVDGQACEVLVDPPESVEQEFRQLLSQSREQSDRFSAEKMMPAVTMDDVRIKVGLNAGLNNNDAGDELPAQTDGIGLYRTEIAFMLTQTFPTEQQQEEWYSALLRQFKGKPVTMRTLDVGSDKALPYLPCTEQNPALGWRGVRVTADQPQILITQLRAMLRANDQYGNLEIMVPMVSRLEELLEVKQTLKAAARDLSDKLGHQVAIPRFGVMIEVPSMVYMMPELAKEIDFFSIGSNDLIQYLLAVDRTNPRVSRFFDPFNPAVVRCLAFIRKEAERLQRPVALCGELAASPLGALLLLSLGYTELSMNYSGLARVKYMLRRVRLSDLKELGAQALTMASAAAIRRLYLDYADRSGLGKIVDLAESGARGYSGFTSTDKEH